MSLRVSTPVVVVRGTVEMQLPPTLCGTFVNLLFPFWNKVRRGSSPYN